MDECWIVRYPDPAQPGAGRVVGTYGSEGEALAAMYPGRTPEEVWRYAQTRVEKWGG